MTTLHLKDQFDIARQLEQLIREEQASSGDPSQVTTYLSDWVRDTQGDMAFAWFPISGPKDQAMFIATNGNVSHAIEAINKYHLSQDEPMSLSEVLEYLDPRIPHPRAQNVAKGNTTSDIRSIPMLLDNRKLILSYILTCIVAFIVVPWQSVLSIPSEGTHLTIRKSVGYNFFWNPPKVGSGLTNTELDVTRLVIELTLITLAFLAAYIFTRKESHNC